MFSIPSILTNTCVNCCKIGELLQAFVFTKIFKHVYAPFKKNFYFSTTIIFANIFTVPTCLKKYMKVIAKKKHCYYTVNGTRTVYLCNTQWYIHVTVENPKD